MSGQRSAQTEVAVPTLRLEFQGEQRSFRLVPHSAHAFSDHSSNHSFEEQESRCLTLGRNPSCHLVVPSNWQVVSSVQAVLQQEGVDYRIYDGNGQGQPSTTECRVNRGHGDRLLSNETGDAKSSRAIVARTSPPK